jgi:hypothetical protein
VNISSIPFGDWKLICAIYKGAVKDEFHVDFSKSAQGSAIQNAWRSTTLNVQQKTSEDRQEIILTNAEENSAIPLSLKAERGESGNLIFRIDCQSILSEEQFIAYSLNTTDEAVDIVADDKIDGEGEKIAPIFIEGAKTNTSYYLSIGLYHNDGSHKVLKGYMAFSGKGNQTDFRFEGEWIDLTVESYGILNYE